MSSNKRTPEWEFVSAYTDYDWHCRTYRDERLGLQKELYYKDGKLFKSLYFIGNKAQYFVSEDELLKALDE